MSFNGSLGTLLSNSDQQNELWRALLQTFMDNGADSGHLGNLLADARGGRVILDEVVSRSIGPIWQLVKKPFSLKTDFEVSAKMFVEKYTRHLDIARDHFVDHGRIEYTESAPKRRCKYQLIHMQKPPTYKDIAEYQHTGAREWAGWRELFEFADAYRDLDWSRYRVIAPGSQNIDHDESSKGKTVTRMFFPAAARFTEDAKPDLAWKGYKCPDDRFATDLLYLARVYD